ncbi:hypothetical protein RI129_001278 [Pyrocoelia pectoralis]|uniref:Uncharacterized protein n=1 Tax=Pyrocoelia pectoralis TaxID=417401 RepID=A0AAN7VV48_9COLE
MNVINLIRSQFDRRHEGPIKASRKDPTLLSFTSSSGNTHILLIPRFTTPPLVLTETTRTLLSLPLCSSATRPQDHCNGGRLSSFTITMSPTERSCFASFHLVRCCS